MQILSILGIIIALAAGFFIWQTQLKQTSDQLNQEPLINSVANSQPADNSGTAAGLQNVIQKIKIPMTKLDLSNQGLTRVPEDTFDQLAIQELDISGNKLTGAIQAEIRQLSNLEVLDMSDNQLTGVPAEVGQLSRLRVLDLSNNQLTGLPYELANLKKLEILNLSGNNYAQQDLEIIKKGLPADVQIVY